MPSAPTGLSSSPVPLSRRLRAVPYGVDVWCPVVRSQEVGKRGIAHTEVQGCPVVVFRGEDGVVRALEDRCPHRGVALSLGQVKGQGLQCGYHGWVLDGAGAVCRAPGNPALEGAPRVRSYACQEALGLVWLFVGAPERAASVPLATPTPFGKGVGADLLLSLDAEGHWSLALDNGLDLFHQHLHRDVPFFFQVHRLIEHGPRGESFIVRYDATLRDAINRKRQGQITLTLTGNTLLLDFHGFPIIHAVVTPRSMDGRRITLWWLMTFPTNAIGRAFLRLYMPVLRMQTLRGFQQDLVMFASEQRGLDRGPQPQLEVNPVITDAHRFLEDIISRRAQETIEQRLPGVALEEVARSQLIERAQRGELAVLSPEGGRVALVDAGTLDETLPAHRRLSVARYEHFYTVLGGADVVERSGIQAK